MFPKLTSKKETAIVIITTIIKTIRVDCITICFVGQTTFFISLFVSEKKFLILKLNYPLSKKYFINYFWQARQESNLQPTVLETATLPIELLAYQLIAPDCHLKNSSWQRAHLYLSKNKKDKNYLVSLWSVCFLHQRQYFFNNNLSGLFFFSLLVV